MPKRYTGGVTDLPASDPAGALALMDKAKYSVYHEDFSDPAFGAANLDGAATGYSAGWFRSGVNAAVNIGTIADAGIQGCGLKIDNGGATDNVAGLLQRSGGAFVMSSGYKFFMEVNFEITAATMSDHEMFLGLSQEVATLDANWFAADGTARTFDDGVGWVKYDGTDDINFIIGEADVFDTHIQIATPVTATWYKVSMYYDGTYIYLYTNDVLVAKTTPDQYPVTKCTPTYYFKSGTTEAAQVIVDYMTIVAEM